MSQRWYVKWPVIIGLAFLIRLLAVWLTPTPIDAVMFIAGVALIGVLDLWWGGTDE